MINVGILGAGGFTGIELLKWLAPRKDVTVKIITSNEYAGKKLVDVFPVLENPRYTTLSFSTHPQSAAQFASCDIVFLAVPDDAALKWAPLFLKQGLKVVDISGSFRLKNAADFLEYYKIEHNAPKELEQAVYGLCEMNLEAVSKANLVANPGCYPTGSILPLLAIKEHLSNFEPRLIIDAKSGTSGAGGRKEKDSLGYSTVNENFRAYRIEQHQHTPEVAQLAAQFFNQTVAVRFTPHLLPMFRGIFTTMYLIAKNANIPIEAIKQSASQFAERKPFVRYFADSNRVELKNVQHTNYIDFGLHYDPQTQVLEIVSAIDNLVKGAAGQAIQNMNVMFGLDETTGLL